jgi:hypothetical protein
MGQAVLFRMRQDLDILVPGSRYSNVCSARGCLYVSLNDS